MSKSYIKAKDLTSGNEFHTIIIFAIPFILQNIAQQMYSFIDGLIAARYLGVEQFAAIGAVSTLVGLLRSFAMGLMIGTSIILAQSIGEKDNTKISNSISIMFQIAIMCSILITVIGCSQCNNLIHLLDIPKELVQYASNYLTLIFLGTIFSFTSNAITSIYKSYGDSKTPLYIMCFSLIINLSLDYLFVRYFRLGIQGIALATVISEALALLLLFFIIRKRVKARLHVNIFHLHEFNTYKECLSCGIPSAIQQSVVQLGFTLNQGFINSFGTTTISAVSAASKIETFGSLALTNIGVAMSTYSAQNYGAKKPRRIASGFKQMRLFIILFSLLSAILINLFARPLLGFFVDLNEKNYPEIMSEGCSYLKTIGMFLFLFGLISITNGTLRGIGNVLITAVGAIASLGTRLIMGLILKNLGYGPASIWIAIPIGWLAGLTITSIKIYSLNFMQNDYS